MAGPGKTDEEREDWFEVMGLGWDATADDVKDGAFGSRVCVCVVCWGGHDDVMRRAPVIPSYPCPHASFPISHDSVQEAGPQIPPRRVRMP